MTQRLSTQTDAIVLKGLTDFQRDLSAATSPANLIRRYIGHLSHLINLDRLIYVLPWPPPTRRYAWIPGSDVPTGSLGYRVLFDAEIAPDTQVNDAQLASMFNPSPRHESDAREGICGTIIKGTHAVRIGDIQAAPDDPMFGRPHNQFRSLAAVPIFWAGEVQAWIIAVSQTADAYNDDDLRLLLTTGNMLARAAVYLDAVDIATNAKGQLQKTLDEIGRVQRSLLPPTPRPDPRLAIASTYLPCEASGGDYFDHRRFGSDVYRLIVADVAGHGPVAAVAMAVFRTATMALCADEENPLSIVPALNQVLLESFEDGLFVTALFLTMDVSTGEIAIVNAGHPPPLVRRRSGQVETLQGNSTIPLGILPDLQPTIDRFSLQPGEIVTLYSDGISEARSPRDEMFGVDRIRTYVAEGEPDPKSIQRNFVSRLLEHMRERPRGDDQTLLIARWNGPDSSPA